MSALGSPVQAYDFLLKFLLVGDSDVGKGEILASLQDGAAESPTATRRGSTTGPPPSYWTAGGSSCSSGICQGREDSAPSSAPTRGSAQGVILVYDIANRWSFDGIAQWIKEIDEHAPGVPRILVGNRLHLAFKRQGPREQAQAYAERLGVTFFEVSPLCNFNVRESFTELARIVLLRHGVDRLWRPRKVLSLQDLCCRAVVSRTPVHLEDELPLPGGGGLRSRLKSFCMASGLNARMRRSTSYCVAAGSARRSSSPCRPGATRPPQSAPRLGPRSSCEIA